MVKYFLPHTVYEKIDQAQEQDDQRIRREQ